MGWNDLEIKNKNSSRTFFKKANQKTESYVHILFIVITII